MKRHYLEEDIELIQRYFPGAKAVALRTPFDLTPRKNPARAQLDQFRDDEQGGHWYGGLLWSR